MAACPLCPAPMKSFLARPVRFLKNQHLWRVHCRGARGRAMAARRRSIIALKSMALAAMRRPSSYGRYSRLAATETRKKAAKAVQCPVRGARDVWHNGDGVGVMSRHYAGKMLYLLHAQSYNMVYPDSSRNCERRRRRKRRSASGGFRFR